MPEIGSPFQLRLPAFEGPLTELFRLACERRVDLESMLVAGITSQIARYVAESDHLDLDYTGEALAVASRLLALKSGRLLLQETDSEEERASDNTEREPLIEYGQMRQFASDLRSLEGRECFSSVAVPHFLARRLEPRKPDALARAWSSMHQRTNEVTGRVALASFLRLETAISSLIRGLRASTRLSFRRLTRESSRNDVVVHFLAVLELCRRHEATTFQAELFGDITIEQRERGAGEDAASRAG